MKHAIGFVFFSLLITAFCVWQVGQWRLAGVRQNDDGVYAPLDSARTLHQVVPKPSKDDATGTLYERLSPVFEKRYDQYKANLESLNANLWHQLIFVVAALVVVMQKSDKFTIPVIERDVEIRWVYLAIPICLTYLWIRFGFLLNQLIDARVMLWKITEVLCPPSLFATSEEWHQALKTFSQLPAVYDGGFLDGWFITFKTQYAIFAKPHPVSTLLMALFGVFFGISNGTALGMLLHGRERFAESNLQARWYAAYFWAVALLLGICHWTFWHEGQYPNFQQPIIVVSASIVVCVLATISPRRRKRN